MSTTMNPQHGTTTKPSYTTQTRLIRGRGGHGRTTDGKLDVILPSIADPERAADMVRGAHELCPYSRAPRIARRCVGTLRPAIHTFGRRSG